MVLKFSKTAKRFGPRYGNTLRNRVSKIESISRKTHKCIFCEKTSVKRKAYGIWECRSCGKKFVGKAYTPYLK